MENRQTIGIVVVHGIGDQERYETLKQFTESFFEALKRRSSQNKRLLLISKVELNRQLTRTSETSDVEAHFTDSAGGGDDRQHLFRPVQILDGDNWIRLYEAYWADEDLAFTPWRKILYNFWLVGTGLRPIYNQGAGKYTAHPLPPEEWAKEFAKVTLILGVYYLAEMVVMLASYLPVLRSIQGVRKLGELIYEYAADVQLYTSAKQYFYRQTKREAIAARFDEVLLKACLENDEVHVVGHSLGSVVAYEGLREHYPHPSKMSIDFLRYLSGRWGLSVLVDIPQRVRTLVTVGSPLDKFYFFWPVLINPMRRAQRSVRLTLETDTRRRDDREEQEAHWESDLESSSSPSELVWYNVTEVADPVGAKLDFYGNKVRNNIFVQHWLPSRAHTRYFSNPRFMEWLLEAVYPADPRAGRATLGAKNWKEADGRWRRGAAARYLANAGLVLATALGLLVAAVKLAAWGLEGAQRGLTYLGWGAGRLGWAVQWGHNTLVIHSWWDYLWIALGLLGLFAATLLLVVYPIARRYWKRADVMLAAHAEQRAVRS